MGDLPTHLLFFLFVKKIIHSANSTRQRDVQDSPSKPRPRKAACDSAVAPRVTRAVCIRMP